MQLRYNLSRRIDAVVRACGKRTFIIVSALLASVVAPALGQEPIEVGNRRQLLLDEKLVQQRRSIDFVVHSPRKTGEIIVASVPEMSLGGYHTVLFDSGRYHLWYSAAGCVLYLRSTDGIHWETPNLNLGGAPRSGGMVNAPNVVLGRGIGGVKGGMHGLMVFLDPNATPDERFKLVCNPHEFDSQLQIFSSPDGVHWKRAHRDVITFDPAVKPNHLDSQNVIFWDERLQKYVAYFRKNTRDPGLGGVKIERTRTVARAESTDLRFFAKVDNDTPEVLRADPDNVVKPFSPQRGWTLLDVYTSGAIKYPWADNAYLMFPTEYYHYGPQIAEFREQFPVNAGAVDTRFASSRDGIAWQRYDHRAFVGVGMKEDFDSKRIYMVYGIVPAKNEHELFMYYMGTSETHGWDRDDRNNRLLTSAGLAPTAPTVISRVVLRRDGFVSARAGFNWGEFTTPVLSFSGTQLLLNVNTGAAGELRVEILDPTGKPYPDLSINNCDLIHTANEVNRIVKWKGATSLESVAGKPIRLRFVLRDTDLFAFQFAERGGI